MEARLSRYALAGDQVNTMADEPSLGSLEGINQDKWSGGGTDDRGNEHDGSEPCCEDEGLNPMMKASREEHDMATLHDFQPVNGREAQALAPICEPDIVSTTFLTGTAVDAHDMVRIVGWDQTQSIAGEPAERRIVMRLAMSDSTARDPMVALRRALTRGGN